MGATTLEAQHLGPDGLPAPGWPVAGKPIGGTPEQPRILADGSGGVFVLWLEWEVLANGDTALQPRMVRIDADGSVHPGWSATGNPLVVLPTSPAYVWQLASDGAGGILVAMTRFDGGTSRVFVQRLNGDGTRPTAWPATGLDASVLAGEQLQPVVAGNAGGAVVAWQSSVGGTPRIYAARFRSDGARVGSPGGITVGGVATSSWAPAAVAIDPLDNVSLVWVDKRNGPANTDLWGTVLVSTARSLSAPPPHSDAPGLALTSANPVRGAVHGVFTLRQAGSARVEVHDVEGRRLAVLADGDAVPGSHPFTWDARDADGRPVPAGLYYVSLRSAEGRFTRIIVVAH